MTTWSSAASCLACGVVGSGDWGVIERKGEAEGGVGVGARTDRVGLPGKPLLVGLHYHVLERLQVAALLRQLERPCPAVGALELRVPPEVFGLDLEIGGAERAVAVAADNASDNL